MFVYTIIVGTTNYILKILFISDMFELKKKNQPLIDNMKDNVTSEKWVLQVLKCRSFADSVKC